MKLMTSALRAVRPFLTFCAIAIVAVAAMVAYDAHCARIDRQMKQCQENLRAIEGMKEQWALENRKKPGDMPTRADLADSSVGSQWTFPRCPSGGEYIINAIDSDPVCTSGLPGHKCFIPFKRHECNN